MPWGLYLIRQCETPQRVPLNGAKYFSYMSGSIHNVFFLLLARASTVSCVEDTRVRNELAV